uniref:Uncharacterized protein n=1 Tax=Arundo donax TaxID=35708 RepID=A0A0A9CY12_ARUDO
MIETCQNINRKTVVEPLIHLYRIEVLHMCTALNSRVQQSLSDASSEREKNRDAYTLAYSAKQNVHAVHLQFVYHDIFVASALLNSVPS